MLQKQIEYTINQEALNIISQIAAPIGVIGVTGMYRTGKSYLLNRILLDRSDGFGVGPTINACTKGLWIWGRPLQCQSSTGENMNLIIMDSEGLGALDEDVNHDSRLFSLVVLLSSCFIYNQVGSIDEQAIQSLSLIVDLTKHIHINSNSNCNEVQNDYNEYFPSFFWCIRDFALQLVDADNEPITAKEYMEKSLQEQSGFSDETEEKNRIRRLLKTFFPARDCVTLVRPLLEEDQLQKLHSLELKQLRPEFVQQVQMLRHKLFHGSVKVKQVNGNNLNGLMYANLIQQYVQAVNEGAVPNIESSWRGVCRDSCMRALDSALEMFDSVVFSFQQTSMPCSTLQFKAFFAKTKHAILQLFYRNAIGDATVIKQYEQELLDSIKDKKEDLLESNTSLAQDKMSTFIENEFQTIKNKLNYNQQNKQPNTTSNASTSNNYYNSMDALWTDLQLFMQFLLQHGPQYECSATMIQAFILEQMSLHIPLFNQKQHDQIQSCEAIFKEQLNTLQKVQKDTMENMKRELQLQTQRANDLQEQAAQTQQVLTQNKQKIKENVQNIEALTKSVQNGKSKVSELQNALQAKSDAFDDLNGLLSQNETKMRHELQKLNELHLQKIVFLEASLLDSKKVISKQELQIKEWQKEMEAAQQIQRERHATQIQSLNGKLLNTEQNEKNAQIQNERLSNAMQAQKEQHKALLDQQEGELQKMAVRFTQMTQQFQNEQIRLHQEAEEAKKQQEAIFKDQLNKLSAVSAMLEQSQSQCDLLKTEKDQFKDANQSLQEQLQLTKKELVQQKTELLQSQLLSQQKTEKNINESVAVLQLTNKHLKEKQVYEQQMEKDRQERALEQSRFQSEMEQMQQSFKEQTYQKQQQIQEYKGQIEVFKQQRQLMQEDYKEMQVKRVAEFDILENGYKIQIQRLEAEQQSDIEELQKQHAMQCQENEKHTAQLKHVYETEIQQLNLKHLAEKDKIQHDCDKALQESLNKQALNSEEMQEELSQIRQSEKQLQSQLQSSEFELALQSQNLESLEKTHQMLRKVHAETIMEAQQQMQQVLLQHTNESNVYAGKIQALQRTIAQVENDKQTLQGGTASIQADNLKLNEQYEYLLQESTVEKQNLQSTLAETRRKAQQTNDELLERAVQQERANALLQQSNKFLQSKLEEVSSQLDQSMQSYEHKIQRFKDEHSTLGEQIEKELQQERQSLQSKYDKLKQANAMQIEQGCLKVAQLEKQIQLQQEKTVSLESKLQSAMTSKIKEEQANQLLVAQLKSQSESAVSDLNEQLHALMQQYNLSVLDKERLQSEVTKEQLLWQEKCNFLTQQKEDAFFQLQTQTKQFDSTLQHMLNAKAEESHQSNDIQDMLQQIEAKYATQLADIKTRLDKDLCEERAKSLSLTNIISECKEKTVQLSAQHKAQQESLETRLIEITLLTEKREKEVEALQKENAAMQNTLQKGLVEQQSNNKTRMREMEEKVMQSEMKQQQTRFQLETSSAKYGLERDHLLQQLRDLQEAMARSEAKRDFLAKDNDRLKSTLQRHQNLKKKQILNQSQAANQLQLQLQLQPSSIYTNSNNNVLAANNQNLLLNNNNNNGKLGFGLYDPTSTSNSTRKQINFSEYVQKGRAAGLNSGEGMKNIFNGTANENEFNSIEGVQSQSQYDDEIGVSEFQNMDSIDKN